MIYALFLITFLVCVLLFLILNFKILTEVCSYKIQTPPPISKKPKNK